MLAQHSDAAVRPGLDRLAADLASGRWHERHQDLLRHDEYDLGYRLLIAQRPARPGRRLSTVFSG
jgi:hypothetical protein